MRLRIAIQRIFRNVLLRVPSGAGRRIARVTETFFTEAAVLLFVFPVLDEYVANGQKAVTYKLIVGSLLASMMCYGIAGLIAAFTSEGED